MGDRSRSNIARPSKRHAVLVVNSAKTLVSFLFETPKSYAVSNAATTQYAERCNLMLKARDGHEDMHPVWSRIAGHRRRFFMRSAWAGTASPHAARTADESCEGNALRKNPAAEHAKQREYAERTKDKRRMRPTLPGPPPRGTASPRPRGRETRRHLPAMRTPRCRRTRQPSSRRSAATSHRVGASPSPARTARRP